MGRKSTRENKTVYQIAREKEALSREAASELLEFMTDDRIDRIERELSYPNPDEVLKMSEVYKVPELCNHFCTHECAIGQKYVPEITMAELPAIILSTIANLNAMKPLTDRLIEISSDGKISDDEISDFATIKARLDDVNRSVETLNYWVEKTICNDEINVTLLHNELEKRQ